MKQSPDTLIHIFIDEIPFSSFLDENGEKWHRMIGCVSSQSNVWLTSRLPLYLWFQVSLFSPEIMPVVINKMKLSKVTYFEWRPSSTITKSWAYSQVHQTSRTAK